MTGHGGKRQGAGRKPRPHPEQVVKLRATAEELAEIHSLDTRERTLALLKRRAEMADYRLTTDDRVAQVGWLEEFAGNIAQNQGYVTDSTAEDLVEYYLSSEEWGLELPEWFNDHDRALLVRMVGDRL